MKILLLAINEFDHTLVNKCRADEFFAWKNVFVQNSYSYVDRAAWAKTINEQTYDLEYYREVNTPIAVDTLK